MMQKISTSIYSNIAQLHCSTAKLSKISLIYNHCVLNVIKIVTMFEKINLKLIKNQYFPFIPFPILVLEAFIQKRKDPLK